MTMKSKMILGTATALAVACSAWLGVTAQPQKPTLKIQWMNDAVYYHTNDMVYDQERNKTNPQPSFFFYTKTVITTNKVEPWHFRFGDREVELGAREDGVILWRNRE